MSVSRSPTLRDVAERLGISTATASNALGGTGRVSAALVEEVRRVASEIGYVPRLAGRALRTGRTATIGLVVPNIANPLFPVLTQAVDREARARGYAVLIGEATDEAGSQGEVMADLVARGAEALIVVPRRGTSVGRPPVPVVVVDHGGSPENTVASDHRAAGALIAEHLLSLGHRRLMVLAGPENSGIGRERLAGLQEAICRAGDAAAEIRACDLGIEGGEAAVEAGLPAGVTALVALFDELAIGAMRALKRLGFEVPRDISVAGCDDIAWGAYVDPPLTTVHQDLPRVAEIAVEVAIGERAAAGDLVPVELVVRGSTAPPYG